MGFLARIVAWESRGPERVAHRCAGRATSYAEVLQGAQAVARHLTASGHVLGAPIVLLGHREPEMLAGMLGCALAGHPYVPIDDATPRARVERIVQIANAAATLTPADIRRLAPRSDHALVPAPADTRDICYVMFTSGSTGDPKGVQISHGNLDHFIDWMIAEQRFGEGEEVFLNQANLSFDLSVMDVYLSLVTGGTLVSLTREDVGNPRAMYQRLAESGITSWVSTPSFAGLCLVERSFTKAMLPHLRRFLFCGEVLPADVARALLDRFPGVEVWNTYGPTEATVATTSIRCTRELLDRYPDIPVGVAMRGTRVLVCDDDGTEVAPGERGEIVIAGPNVSPGYLHQPELSERVFSVLDGARSYRTGDWGRYRDGLLFCEGRRDLQIKLHGYRIEPGDIEAQLRLATGVRDAAVIPQLHHGKATALVALVLCEEPPPDARAAAEHLRAHLAQRLPAYMLPRHIRFVSQFPLTPNGKIDRRALAASVMPAP